MAFDGTPKESLETLPPIFYDDFKKELTKLWTLPPTPTPVTELYYSNSRFTWVNALHLKLDSLPVPPPIESWSDNYRLTNLEQQVLYHAAIYLHDPRYWHKGSARSNKAVCLGQAIDDVCRQTELGSISPRFVEAINHQVKTRLGILNFSIIPFNDHPQTNHTHIMKLLHAII